MTKLKIELGKRYVRRDGEVTDPIEYSNYPFRDPKTGVTFTALGQRYFDAASKLALIEEYVEPTKVEVWAAVDVLDGCVLSTANSKECLQEYYRSYLGVEIVKMEVTDDF